MHQKLTYCCYQDFTSKELNFVLIQLFPTNNNQLNYLYFTLS